ncbi:MAG: peptidoglycan DD-metalloendopeptidase family protein [Acidobacteriota bacterium]|nr:peptidoglycan DD-metalloendopeptidase family protein [Acidobacteriota bacterium]
MPRDDRFYAFIIAHTSRSRSRIRRVCVGKKWLNFFSVAALVLFFGCAYGFYGLTQQALHLRVETENRRLRSENERQQRELNKLSNRVEAVEDTSRKLAEKSGVIAANTATPGSGGPAIPVESESLAELESKMNRIEQDLRRYETEIGNSHTPSIWPVAGTLESGFGGRRNPFGGSSYEFHSGQDIDAEWGAPVIAGANGTVTFSGWQNGYGQLVVIDHGRGLTTRYGHLSAIAASVGQLIQRGEFLGQVGSTGRSTGPHLHYEVRINDQPVNPLQYLRASSY